MKKLRKFSQFIVTLVLLVFVVSGCAKTQADTNEEAQPKEETEETSKYTHRDLTVTTVGTIYPYSFVDESNSEWTGSDGEIWQAIEDLTGWNITVERAGTFDATLGTLASGRADIASNNFSPTNSTRKPTCKTSHKVHL